MADKQIHELSSLSRDPISTDVFAVDTGTVTNKISFGTLGSAFLGTVQSSSIASEYSTSSAYAVGDYCTHDGTLYRCTVSIPSGESWTSSHWTSTTLGSDLSNARKGLIAAAYSTSSTYAVGDYCTRGNTLYRCTTGINIAEAWTSSHWVAVKVGGELDSISDTLSTAQGNITTLQGNVSTLNTAVNGKVSIAQGASNVNKFLVVDSSGNVSLASIIVPVISVDGNTLVVTGHI